MLHNLQSPKTNKKSKQLGRGTSSGVGGHTVGRGGKGATARSGFQYPRRWFEGGQNPINKRLPKLRGEARKGHAGTAGKAIRANTVKAVIKLSELESKVKLENPEKVDMQYLAGSGLLRLRYNKEISPKILFDKEVNTSIKIEGIKVSKKVKDAITKAGGSVN